MDEKEQEKSELPPLLGTKEVKESEELEKEDWKVTWFNNQIVPFIEMFLLINLSKWEEYVICLETKIKPRRAESKGYIGKENSWNWNPGEG